MHLAGSYLSSSEMQALARIFAGAESGPLPLGETLRSASREATSAPLQAALQTLAQQVEQGTPLETAVGALGTRLSFHHQAVLNAAVQSGELSPFLTQWRLQDAQRGRSWRSIQLALAYPLLLFCLAALLLPLGAYYVIRPTREIVENFGLSVMPWILRNAWITWLPLSAILLTIALVTLSRFQRYRGSPGFDTYFPLFGSLIQLDGIAHWLRTLQLLVDRQIPLPQAIRLASATCEEPSIRLLGQQTALQVEQGSPLSVACWRQGIVPPSCLPWLELGERQNLLAPSLGLAAGLLQRRLERRVDLITSILPFLISGLAVFAALGFMGSISGSTAGLIQGLSGTGPSGPEPVKFNLEPMLLGCIPGLAILIARSLIFGRAGRGTYSWILVSMIGHFLLLIGAVSLAYLAGGMLLGTVFLLFSFYFWEMYLIGIRQEADDTLLDAVGLALQKNLSPVSLALAVAVQSTGWASLRAERLAKALQAGVPLNHAVSQARIWLSPTQRVALEVGTELGLAGKFLEADYQAKTAAGRRPPEMFGNLVYLGAVSLTIFGILTFVMLKIVPVFDKMFQEFGLKLPGITLSLLSFSRASVHYWFVWFFLIFFIFLPLTIILHSLSLGWAPSRFPFLSRWIGPADSALALRALSQGIAAGLNPLQVLSSLARNYPKPYLAQRLNATFIQATEGTDLVEALQKNKIVSAGLKTLLQAAVRSKHLSWALLEGADGILRRQQLRWRVLTQLLNPCLTLVLGLFVGYVVVALFLPLLSLIEGLSGGEPS